MTNEEFTSDVTDVLWVSERDAAVCETCSYKREVSYNSKTKEYEYKCIRWPHIIEYPGTAFCPEYAQVFGWVYGRCESNPRIENILCLLEDKFDIYKKKGEFPETPVIALLELVKPLELPKSEYFWYFSPIEDVANKIGITLDRVEYHSDGAGFFAYKLFFSTLTKVEKNDNI